MLLNILEILTTFEDVTKSVQIENEFSSSYVLRCITDLESVISLSKLEYHTNLLRI